MVKSENWWFFIFIVLQNGNFIYFTEALPFINSIDSKLKKRRTKDGLVQIKFSLKKKLQLHPEIKPLWTYGKLSYSSGIQKLCACVRMYRSILDKDSSESFISGLTTPNLTH